MILRAKKPKINADDLQGFKYFDVLKPFLDRLHLCSTERDHAGNRTLFFDQFASLELLYFFNPILTSLRGIQQASTLSKVQTILGCNKTSLTSLSEASRIFDPQPLREIIQELAAQVRPLGAGKEAQALQNLTAVDGSLLPALPRMAWALWLDDQHHAAKMHLHFDVLKGVPCDATLTHGNASETKQLRDSLQPGRLYVIDRGYAEYQLFQDIIDRGSGFIGRIRSNAVWNVVEERPVSTEAWDAGVRRDLVVDLGCPQSGACLKQSLRIVEVDTGQTHGKGQAQILLLATNRLDLDADLVALGYRHRWSVELFFRWFKCILGCKHLLSQSQNGITIQVYLALIASLLISLWTGKKPTKRTFEMLQFYFCGMASEEELMAHIAKLHSQDERQR